MPLPLAASKFVCLLVLRRATAMNGIADPMLANDFHIFECVRKLINSGIASASAAAATKRNNKQADLFLPLLNDVRICNVMLLPGWSLHVAAIVMNELPRDGRAREGKTTNKIIMSSTSSPSSESESSSSSSS